MANNRLYILDTATGESLMIAKSFGDGWYFRFWDNEEGCSLTLDEASDWLKFSRDPYIIRDLKCQYGSDRSNLKLVTEQELIDYKKENGTRSENNTRTDRYSKQTD